MKKILFLCITICLVLIIYIFTRDNKQYIVIFGDYVCKNNNLDSSIKNAKGKNVENYVNNCKNDNTIQEVLNIIENNNKIIYQKKNYTSNNLLIKADTIILSVGMNDLLNYHQETNMYSYIDDLMIDMDELLSLVRFYSKEKIYVYNYFGLDKKYLKYANRRLNELANEYNVYIIDISTIKNKIKLNENDKKLIINHTLKNI